MENLTFENQAKLYDMIKSKDLEIKILALNIVSQLSRPGAYINFINSYSLTGTISFDKIVREEAMSLLCSYYMMLALPNKINPTVFPILQANKDLLEKLIKY